MILSQKIKVTISCILILVAYTLRCQAPYYYSLSEENGLPSSEVYQVKQDPNGFIWIGCDAGLYRFDGVNYKSYKTVKGNGRSISGLKLDRFGRIWCQNFAGQIYRVKGDSLELVYDFSTKFRAYPQFSVDNKNNLWVVSEKCIFKIDSMGKLKNQWINMSLNGDTLLWQDIEVNSENKIYATAVNAGLLKITENSSKIELTEISKLKKSAPRTHLEVTKDKVYVINEYELEKKYSIVGLKNDKPFFNTKIIDIDAYVYQIYESDNNEVFLCTSNGTFKFDQNKLSLINNTQLFKGDKISSMLKDREGNWWFSSLQNGVYVIPTRELTIYNATNSKLPENYISSLMALPPNKLMIGTYSGKLIELQTNGIITAYPVNREKYYRASKKIDSYANGFFVSRGSFSFIKNLKEITLPLKNIRDYCILNNDLFYTSTHSIGKIEKIDAFLSDAKAIQSTKTILPKSGTSIVSDNKKLIYFSSNDGLYSYSDNKLKQILFNNKRIDASKLYFFNDELWISTINHGFLTYSKEQFNTQEKLNSIIKGNYIKTFSIYENILFVATEEGLNRINLSNLKNDFFDLSDGLISREINDIAILNDRLFIASNRGLLELPKATTQLNTISPSIKITSLFVNSKPVFLSKGLTKLTSSSRQITFSFETSCIRARGNFFYKYRLLGLDSTWTLLKAQSNKIVFSVLPAGSFTFEVKAVNEDAKESLLADKVIFEVEKSFYQNWWFYILIGLAGAFFALFIFLWIIKNIKKKATIKNELVSSQLTAIRAQMNPHFMYNTLNSIQDLILKSDLKNTNYYLSKFSTLMRKVLEFSANETIILNEEIEMLNDYLELEKLRFGDEFNYTISIATEIKLHQTRIPSLIVQPFVENAVKHGLLHRKGEKKLSLNIDIVNNNLIIVIEDNGVGRKRSAEIKSRSHLQHKSFAISAVQKRLSLLNRNGVNLIKYNITDLFLDKEPTGTKVEITVSL